MEVLEKRVLYSADPFSSVLLDVLNASAEQPESRLSADEFDQLSAPIINPAAATSLVIVDLSHDDLSLLHKTLVDQYNGTTTHIVALDGGEDVYDQLSELLAQYSELDAIHLLSHGSDGQLHVGGQTIDSNGLKDNAARINQWGKSLSAGGDLLLYGCNLSASQSGQEFALTLSQLMQADVASSDDITGHPRLNGDWDLEIEFGELETPALLDQASQASWLGTLAPLAAKDFINVAEGGTTTMTSGGQLSLLANDNDGGNGPITVTSFSGGSNASVFQVNPDGTFVYTHDGSETTSDSFSYTIEDASGSTSTATVQISISPVNDAPVAVDDAITVAAGGVATVLDNGFQKFSQNDTDAESGNNLSVTIVDLPVNGTLTIDQNGLFVYTHDGSANLSDTITYRVTDAGGAVSNLGTVLINGPPANTPPVAADDNAMVDEGDQVSINVVGNDTDADGGALTPTIVNPPVNGTLTLNLDNTYTYAHDGSETLSDSFTYFVTDNAGADSNEATVSITVKPTNDEPIAADDTATVLEADSVDISVLNNDSDADLDTLTVQSVTTPANGTATINADNTVTYAHDGFESTTDTFDYVISDGNGGLETATVSITITPVNDIPVVLGDAASVAESGTVDIAVLNNDSDAENDPLTVRLVSGPTNGTVTINPDNSVTYVHDGSETTADNFSYEVNDGTDTSSLATAWITITPVNDNPIAVSNDVLVIEGGQQTFNVLNNDTDAEGDVLTPVVVTAPTKGTLILNPDNTYTYTHDGSETVSDSFTYQATDPGGGVSNLVTVTITLIPVNDAPEALDDVAIVSESGTVDIVVLGNDSDVENDPLGVLLFSGPANGTVTVNPDKSITYVHDGSETTTDTFTYKANDGTNSSDLATVSITITPVNDNPVAVADSVQVDEGDQAVFDVVSNDTDAEGDVLTPALVIAPSNGALILNPDNTYTYTHDGSETLSDS